MIIGVTWKVNSNNKKYCILCAADNFFSRIRVALVLWVPSLSEPEAIRVQVPLMLAWALARIYSPSGALRQEATAFVKTFQPPLRFSSDLNLRHSIIFRISSPIFIIYFLFWFHRIHDIQG